MQGRVLPLRSLVLVCLAHSVVEASPLDGAVRSPRQRLASQLEPPQQAWVFRTFAEGQIDTAQPIPFNLTSGFTLEGWLWLDENAPATFLSFQTTTDRSWVAGLELEADGRLLYFHTEFGVRSKAALPTRRWVHFAGRSAPGKAMLLVDGVVAKEVSVPSPAHLDTLWLQLGDGFRGAFRQWRLWSVPLSDGEIRRYAEERPLSDDPRLFAWWPFDDATTEGPYAVSAQDMTGGGHHLRVGIEGGIPLGRWARPDVLEAGPYFATRELPTEPSITSVARFIDFDHDGDPDIYTIDRLHDPQTTTPPYYHGAPPNPDRAFRNDGGGRFAEVSEAVLIGPRVQGYLCNDLHVADFSGDGLADVFNPENGGEFMFGNGIEDYAWPNSFRAGTAEGLLINESDSRLEPIEEADHRSAYGDIDGDGDLDVVSVDQITQRPIFFVNDGQGVFDTEFDRVGDELLRLSPDTFWTSVTLIDADGDGDLDLFAGDIGSVPYNRLLLNDGAGRFRLSPQEWLPNKLLGAGAITSVESMIPTDLDRDGLPDLVVSEQDNRSEPADPARKPRLQLLLGNGDGSFRDASQHLPQHWGGSKPPSEAVFGVAFFALHPTDLNGDAWPDLVANAGWGMSPTLLINSGPGHFEDAGDLLPTAIVRSGIDGADFDGDGDEDLVLSSLVVENLKPYRPNAFPAADVRLELTVDDSSFPVGGAVRLEASAVNTADSAVNNLYITIPVPHALKLVTLDGGGGACTLDRHIVECRLAELAAGGQWVVAITAAVDPDSRLSPPDTVVASVTGDVLDPDLSNNAARVPFGFARRDSDGDTIPDWLEKRAGLDPTSAGDAAGDRDSDGASNAAEVAAGTDPAVADAPPCQPAFLRFAIGDSANVAEVTLGPDWTIEAWIWTDGSTDYFDAVAHGDKYLQVAERAGLSTGIYAPVPTPRDAWVHVAATVGEGVHHLYVDGEEAGWWSPYDGTPGPVTAPVGLGTYGSGALRQVRLWNRARLGEEIRRDRGRVIPANTTGLVALFPLDDAAGQTLRDLGPHHFQAHRGGSPEPGGDDSDWVAAQPGGCTAQ